MRGRRASLTILSVVLAGALPAGAAARPAGRVPDPHALKRAGLAVTWPFAKPSARVAPGAKLTVKVRRLRAGAPVAHVDLVRVAASGLARNLVVSRHVHAGRVVLTIPKRGDHYLLRLRAGRLTYGTWVDPTPAPATGTPAVPVPPPPPPTSVVSPCPATGTPAATLVLQAGYVATGGTIAYTLTDTGTTCLSYGVAYSWQRKDGDQWTDVPSQTAFPMMAFMLKPGGSYLGTASVEPSMTIGRYRLVVGYFPEPQTAPVTSGPVATAEVDVVPAHADDAAPMPAQG